MYFVKTPALLKKFYPDFIWQIPTGEKILYLTFDDGPHETATPFVLDELEKYNAKATFFCIGKNVLNHPAIYRRILEKGHAVGNHTHNHLNGWKTDDTVYINDVIQAAQHINSHLFRPPYGRIKKFQAKLLQRKNNPMQPLFSIIMWDVLSGDFDINIPPQKCLLNVTTHAGNGSVIVFHDSDKAWSRMSYSFPKVLDYFTQQGFSFQAIQR